MSSPSVDGKLNSSRGPSKANSESTTRRSILIERFFGSRLRLRQLRLLAAIDDAGPLRQVAERLNVTPSAISKQIAEMESALGCEVLRRVGNRVRFTALGELLALRAKDILALIETARTEVDDLLSGAVKTVGIGIAPSVATLFLPCMVSAVKAVAPNATVKLFETHYTHLAPLLKEGTIAFALARETAHAFSLEFVENQVMSDPLLVVCATKHLPKVRRQVRWNDLLGWPWILPTRGTAAYVHLEALLFRHGLTLPAGSIEFNSRTVVADLLQTYPFLALLPQSSARPYINSRALTDLALSTDGMLGTIKAVWRRGSHDPLVQLLLETVRAQARIVEARSQPVP